MVFCLALLGIVEIFLRAVFNFGLSFALEYGTYALCLVMFGGSGWALRRGGHIRAGLLVGLLRPRGQYLVDIAVTAFSLGIAAFVSVAVVTFATDTYRRGTVSIDISQTSLAYPQALFALCTCILALALAARLVRLLFGLPPEEAEPGPPEGGV